MKLTDDELMHQCHRLRRNGISWKTVCDELNVPFERKKSLISTYSKWKNSSKLTSKKKDGGKAVFNEEEFTELVNIMSQAFKEVTVEAQFKMQIPKRLLDMQEALLEEIKLTRQAMEKIVAFGTKIEDLDRDVRIMLENNLPLNRRKR